MKPEYEEFKARLIKIQRSQISNRHELTDVDIVRKRCAYFCKCFIKWFPHLHLVAGHFNEFTEHWWLVDTDGTIVDPTAEQFGNAIGEYEPITSGKYAFAVGKCPNCGEYMYSNEPDAYDGIHKECANDYMAYINRSARTMGRSL